MSNAIRRTGDQIKSLVSPRHSRQGLQTPQHTPHVDRDQNPFDGAGASVPQAAIPQSLQPHPAPQTRNPPSRSATLGTPGGPEQEHTMQDQPLGQTPRQPSPRPPPQPRPPMVQPSDQILAPPPPPLSYANSVVPPTGTDAGGSPNEPLPPRRDGNPNNSQADANHRGVEHNHRPADSIQAETHPIDQRKSLRKRLEALKAREAALGDIDHYVASLETKVREYRSAPYAQEVISIRKHMQVNDLQEVSTIVDAFRRITRKVEDISRDLGERLCESQANGDVKTTEFLQFLLRHSPNKHYKPISIQPYSVDSEDFIDFGCRALLNYWLIESICGPKIFHPGLNPDSNKWFIDLYKDVRKQETQTISGRWRVSTFNACRAHMPDPQDLAIRFCREALTPLCKFIYKREAYDGPIELAFDAIKELFQSAIDWVHMSKTSVVMLDFEPTIIAPGSAFDPQVAKLEGSAKQLPSAVLLTSKLGLLSSRALGKEENAEQTIQVPPTVLAVEYFS